MDTSSGLEAEAPVVNPRLHAMAATENQEYKGLFIFKAGPSKREAVEMLQGLIIERRVVDARTVCDVREAPTIYVARAS